MDTSFYAGVLLVTIILGAMTILVLKSKAVVERFHREGALPYARKHRNGVHG